MYKYFDTIIDIDIEFLGQNSSKKGVLLPHELGEDDRLRPTSI